MKVKKIGSMKKLDKKKTMSMEFDLKNTDNDFIRFSILMKKIYYKFLS